MLIWTLDDLYSREKVGAAEGILLCPDFGHKP